MSTVTKKDLIAQFSKELSLPQKTAGVYVGTVLSLITENLARGEEVDLTGFGKFVVRSRCERSGMNPMTKEPITIPASRTVKFSPKKGLREAVNASKLSNDQPAQSGAEED